MSSERSKRRRYGRNPSCKARRKTQTRHADNNRRVGEEYKRCPVSRRVRWREAEAV